MSWLCALELYTAPLIDYIFQPNPSLPMRDFTRPFDNVKYPAFNYKEVPRAGIRNIGLTCWLNSTIQMLRCVAANGGGLLLNNPEKETVFDLNAQPDAALLKKLNLPLRVQQDANEAFTSINRSFPDTTDLFTRYFTVYIQTEQRCEFHRLISHKIELHSQLNIILLDDDLEFLGLSDAVFKQYNRPIETLSGETYIDIDQDRFDIIPFDQRQNYFGTTSWNDANYITKTYHEMNPDKNQNVEESTVTGHPPFLMIYVNRTKFENVDFSEKIETTLLGVDIITFANDYKYELIAFINHTGDGTKHGHYICHARYTNPTSGENEWFLFDDTEISKPMTPDAAFTEAAQAAMLCYKKLPDPLPP